ncbi:MAG: hypothetical protein PF569_04695 [Candidatus Woesearchaeota archaeon]|jgi:DNA-binding protein H-NS|nr:hypothetical protein [Candidatus Woesearchaeota archaeon]
METKLEIINKIITLKEMFEKEKDEQLKDQIQDQIQDKIKVLMKKFIDI